MEELNTMLARLRSEGDADSSGVFTLSLEKAGEKLAAYRLASPGLFVLNLVASAVMAGAQQFTIETKGEMTLFAFDTLLDLELGQMDGLLGHILDPKASPFVRELALAVHGARSLPGNPQIVLSVSTREWSRDLRISAEEMEVVRAGPRVAGIILRLEYRERSGWSSIFSRRDGARDEAVRHFSHFCRFAPLKIINNGQIMGAQVTGGHFENSIIAWRHLQGEQAMNVAVPERRFGLVVSPKRVSPSVSSIVIALHTPEWAQEQGVLLLSRGVAFRRPSSVLNCPLAHVVITADHLEKNLSQSDLLENHDYELVIEVAKAEVEDLIREVCSNPPLSWRPGNALEFNREVARRYLPGASTPVEVEAYRRLEQMKELCKSEAGQRQQLDFWRLLCSQEPGRAERFHRELTKVFEVSAKQAIVTRFWEDSFPPLASLVELGRYRTDSLMVALKALSGDRDGAVETLQPNLPGYSLLLESLLTGQSPELRESPMAELLAFQHAVEARNLVLADRLMDDLSQRSGTPLLLIWLGWYCLYRKDTKRACDFWESALAKVGGQERTFWSKSLSRELYGKVSFLQQVRWRARRSLEELELAFTSERGIQTLPDESEFHPTDWASAVWRSHFNDQRTQGQELFRNGYLMSLINLEKLSLDPLDSTTSPFAFFP